MRMLAFLATSLFIAASAATMAETLAQPTRDYAKVLFRAPVRIGDRVLFGTYVIEQDNDRMAQGRPCTYIYAADDVQLPVVAFRCRHLDRKGEPDSDSDTSPAA